MRKTAAVLAVLAILAAVLFVYLTRAMPLSAIAVPDYSPDLANGERMFHAGGCISCHKPAENDSSDPLLPSGGLVAFRTPAGTFYAPNLTPDRETGIGAWNDVDFVNAMQRGISPAGHHYIPAFPYSSYASMRLSDVLDIKGYLMGLKPVRSAQRPPELPFGLPVEWLARRGIGLWKLIAFSDRPFEPDPEASAAWNRGAYLVNGPGHCGECHTPRNFLLMPIVNQRFAGGPHPDPAQAAQDCTVPSLRGLIAPGRYRDSDDLILVLTQQNIFDLRTIGRCKMDDVQASLLKLPGTDISAIVEYLTSLKLIGPSG